LHRPSVYLRLLVRMVGKRSAQGLIYLPLYVRFTQSANAMQAVNFVCTALAQVYPVALRAGMATAD